MNIGFDIFVAASNSKPRAKAKTDYVCTGVNIRTRNNCHKTVCSTAERLSYFPMYGETIFDTDLNQSVICLDPERGTWVDTMGNRV